MMSMRRELIVVALGGNALLRRGQRGTFEEQYQNVKVTAKFLADLIQRGYRLTITHGNGPQIGATLLRHDAGERLYRVPAFPMDVCGAETQGFVGYMIQQALRNELHRRGIDRDVVTVVTRVAVDKDDPAFQNPTKPVGPFYTHEQMEELRRTHPEYVFREDRARGGWRRVVPSPDPKYIIECNAIKVLAENGVIVIASGGGGIPVVEEGGEMRGVEAVIDKDLASERLATFLKADKFVILTDVDGVYINFGRPDQRRLTKIRVDELKRYLEEGHFPAGSMKPKVEAVIRFIESGGKEAIIAELSQLLDAVEGDAGTHVYP